MTAVPRASLPLAAMLALAAASAAAEEIPSSWWQARMNESFASLPHVRVRGPVGSFVLREPQVDSSGVRFAGFETSRAWYEDRGAAASERPVPPAPIPWNEIDRVETPVRATGFGALVGAALGTAVALGVAASGGFDQESLESDVHPALYIAGGAAVGAAFGSTMKRWRVYYPPS
jgi:hypothetical protein